MKKIIFTMIAVASIVCVAIYEWPKDKEISSNGQADQWEKRNPAGLTRNRQEPSE